jgi:MFS family permease
VPESVEGSRLSAARTRLASAIPAPLRRATFRQLWVGMGSSYAGDRLQQLAQTWLVATLTSSALVVGWITTLGLLRSLLLPLGGVIADQVDRRRLLIAWQLVGAAATASVTALVLTGRVAIWHIYAWAVVNGLIALLSRPAYKVVLTEVVPTGEVRTAVAINSMTETTSMVVVSGIGSLLLGLLGLPLAFVVNTATYLVAAASLWGLRDLSRRSTGQSPALDVRRVLSDLVAGLIYLAHQPRILPPLLLTFLTIATISPAIGLLASIVHAQDGSIVDLGLLAASTSLGAFVGAGFAGVRSAGGNPTRRYAFLGLASAAALVLFVYLPVGFLSMAPLAVIGAAAFAQAVWNTSRIRELADPAYQARLQAITSMAFTLGLSLGTLWAGVAIDRFGLTALVGGPPSWACCRLSLPFFVRVEEMHERMGALDPVRVPLACDRPLLVFLIPRCTVALFYPSSQTPSRGQPHARLSPTPVPAPSPGFQDDRHGLLTSERDRLY